MNLPQSEQAILNGIYAAVAWLILDLGFLFQEHGEQAPAILLSSPEAAGGTFIGIACIVGLIYKSRIAAIALFLVFLLPLVLRMAQGSFPSTMLLIFSAILLYFFYSAILGTFSYRYLKTGKADDAESQ
jgi:hypothetical protein